MFESFRAMSEQCHKETWEETPGGWGTHQCQWPAAWWSAG